MPIYTTNLLNNGGVTTHYTFQYDNTLDSSVFPGQPEPDRTNAAMAECERDFNTMSMWFGGIELSNRLPISVFINTDNNGGSWHIGAFESTSISIGVGTEGEAVVRYQLVMEMVEQFMRTLNNGWYGDHTEGSQGEGLSRFLAAQFWASNERGFPPAGWQDSNNWLRSTREDFVNNIDRHDDALDAKTGCALLFIYYLHAQLGFSINNIISAGANTLGGVYRNLTGAHDNPFPFFKLLIDNAYPGTSEITTGDKDNPFPLAIVSFWVNKSTFGKSEVQDVINTGGGRFDNAFWIVIEGFSINTFHSFNVVIPDLVGSFINEISGVSIVRSPSAIVFENPDNPAVPQRIRISYDIVFTPRSLTAFPNVGENPVLKTLDARVLVSGDTPRGAIATASFEFTNGADPYFTNIDAAAGRNNVYWLSNDLRVFSAAPAINNTPIPRGPVFRNDSVNGAFDYIQQLLTYLNTEHNSPDGEDPFESILPGQTAAFSGDSSVTPVVFNNDADRPDERIQNNYNFAIARVRLRGVTGGEARNVKVFFRLWTTQTADTDFQPNTTYLSTDHRQAPLVGSENNTIPFFATGNFSSHSDYVDSGVNNKTISLDTGDLKWAYFGCFINLYDPLNLINGRQVQTLLNGTHHCLVAEIACDYAPIPTTSPVTPSPENSDKLAQRNLQISFSDNPGDASTHRVLQTFDIRPSQPLLNIPQSLLNYPDELMIDWGNTPVDAIASIYWPQVDAAEVLNLAKQLYATNTLTAPDSNTIQCKVTRGVTYLPIPVAGGQNFAGLITIDLPTTVITGQEYNIVVRRVTTKRFPGPSPKENESLKSKNWRYITGSFQIKIPVGTPETILAPEQNILAIFKWRLVQMSPSNRWYPVLLRYISYLTAKVNGLGGNADSIKPSPRGYWDTSKISIKLTKRIIQLILSYLKSLKALFHRNGATKKNSKK